MGPGEIPAPLSSMTAGQQAAIVASAQDWAKAQVQGANRHSMKTGNLAGLETVEGRAKESGASERTQRMADKVAKAGRESYQGWYDCLRIGSSRPFLTRPALDRRMGKDRQQKESTVTLTVDFFSEFMKRLTGNGCRRQFDRARPTRNTRKASRIDWLFCFLCIMQARVAAAQAGPDSRTDGRSCRP